jgi:predicted pyridoxine 5'-phosphate oxidase superfamily flavin-nucleotide-binding protein
MATAFAEITFTDAVKAAQERHGSRASYARLEHADAPRRDRLGPKERQFIMVRDGFYQATVTADGWPYVQFRGGQPGFLKVLDDRTIAYADFSGNKQYLSTGNLAGNDRMALILMDYAGRRRLKLWGRARLVDAAADPLLIEALADPDYPATIERAVVITVGALDWNCPQHITPRFSEVELEAVLAPVRDEIAVLRAENARLKAAHATV